MARNRKLTNVIEGRVIKAASTENGACNVVFDDGSTMRIKLGSDLNCEAHIGRVIKAVRQDGSLMNLDFADGTSAAISLAEATSSVMLRDHEGVLEYAD